MAIDEDESDGDIKVTVENDVATLLIGNAQPDKHSGLYTCHMKTQAGEASVSVKCTVVQP